MSVDLLKLVPNGLGLSGPSLIRRVAQWWLREFLALFPARLADWLIDDGSKRLVLSADEEEVRFELLTERGRRLASNRMKHSDYAPDAIDRFLRTRGFRRSEIVLGIRLPVDAMFARTALLPLETERTLDGVLTQDLLAKTPFRLDDIFCDHLARRSGDRLRVQQWVVRRQFVTDAAETFGLPPDALAFVEAEAGDGRPPHVRIKREPRNGIGWVCAALMTLTLAASLLAAAAVGTKHHNQQQTLDALAGELSAARTKAQQVRAALDKLETERATLFRLRSRKNQPGLLDIWEETTRILPRHSWLTELRFADASAGQELVITGFSPAAASIVGLVDRSPLFRDAALTGPISIDSNEGKERFTIQAKLRPLDPLKTAAR